MYNYNLNLYILIYLIPLLLIKLMNVNRYIIIFINIYIEL
jgi:hypothetical protein